jgi:hypothetical protein
MAGGRWHKSRSTTVTITSMREHFVAGLVPAAA